jgi:channel protein (hemolysin III family)
VSPHAFVATPLLGIQQPLSVLLHLIGALVYGALTVSLLRRGRSDVKRQVTLAVFASSCVAVLAISGVYHWTPRGGAWRALLQRVDHAAIFVLIAGTLTPFLALVFRGSLRWVMIGAAWTLCVAAIVLKLLFFSELKGALGLALYVSVGSIGLVSVLTLPRRVRLAALAPMALGAVAYVGGALLELSGSPVLLDGIAGPHEFFHAAVLLGTAFHWRFLTRVGDPGSTQHASSHAALEPTGRQAREPDVEPGAPGHEQVMASSQGRAQDALRDVVGREGVRVHAGPGIRTAG